MPAHPGLKPVVITTRTVPDVLIAELLQGPAEAVESDDAQSVAGPRMIDQFGQARTFGTVTRNHVREHANGAGSGEAVRLAGGVLLGRALNLVIADISYWNTVYMDKAASHLQRQGQLPDPKLLKHVSPLGWVHINLTGDYNWDTEADDRTSFRPLNLTPMRMAA